MYRNGLMYRYCIFGVLLLFGVLHANSQSLPFTVIAANGGHGTSAQGSISYTLGELATTTLSATSGIITQGFHQPEAGGSLRIGDGLSVHPDIRLYPNPTKAILYISSPVAIRDVRVIDLHGRVLSLPDYKSAGPDQFSRAVDLTGVAPGLYLIRIRTGEQGQEQITALKVIKEVTP